MKLSRSLPIVLVVLVWVLFNLQHYYTRENKKKSVLTRNGLLITIAQKSKQENLTDVKLQAGTASNQSCCWIATKHKVEYLCSTEHSSLVSYCSCSDYLMCKLVMVTALSSNHFVESIDFFGSVHTHFPKMKVIVYNLGLSTSEVSRIQSYCNVMEVRMFKYHLYPDHTKYLFNYAWKTFLISEMSQEYEVFFYCDASCRMKSIFPHYLPSIFKFPVLPASWLKKSVVKTTHDGMLQFLRVQKSRKELEQLLPRGFQSGTIILWANAMFKEKLLPSLIDCASHLECIAPKGSNHFGCNFALPGYVGCHRYDQSALNVILLRDFGGTMTSLYGDMGELPKDQLVDVQRSRTSQYNNSMSYQCNILYSPVH